MFSLSDRRNSNCKRMNPKRKAPGELTPGALVTISSALSREALIPDPCSLLALSNRGVPELWPFGRLAPSSRVAYSAIAGPRHSATCASDGFCPAAVVILQQARPVPVGA